MPGLTTAPPEAAAHEHLVEFHDGDDQLVRAVANFIAPGLLTGDGAVVVATGEHQAGVQTALVAAGVDVDAAAREGRYLAVDALSLLAAIMVGGSLERTRFEQAIDALVDGAGAGGTRRVRVYGGLVGLLLSRGDTRSTIALERLWDDLARRRGFELLCGYPLRAFDGSPAAFKPVCELHTTVIPPPSRDVTEQERLVAELHEELTTLREELDRLRGDQRDLVDLAYQDPLTGLANRRVFDRELEREWALAARAEPDSFVLVADLDDFKRLNDDLGHAAGDDLLRRFGAALRAVARSGDVVARLGGDEFGALLVRCDERAARAFERRLRAAYAGNVESESDACGVSIGHASLAHSSSPAAALDRADMAMLAIKRSRRRRLGRAPRGSDADG